MLISLLQPPKQRLFLTSSRGSIKSTWLHSTFTEAHLVDLLAEESYQRLLRSPGFFSADLRAVLSKPWVIIDKKQRCSHH
jgi:hypothetical protein